MVFNQTQNTAIKNNIIDELKLNPSVDSIPSVVANSIQPVFEVKKKIVKVVRHATVTTSTNTTIYTTPSDTDFYMTSASISFVKDVACDIASGRCYISIIIDGSTQEILPQSVLTLTAERGQSSITFNPPIKIDRNTAIVNARSGAHAAGNLIRSCAISGYIEETAIKTV